MNIKQALDKDLEIEDFKEYTYLDFDGYFMFTGSQPDYLSNSDLKNFSDFIESTGYGLEPDFRYRKFKAKYTDTVVIFRTEYIPTRLSIEYKAASLSIRLASIFAVYDGTISPHELNELHNYIDSLILLKDYEKQRLNASVYVYFSEKVDHNLLSYIVNRISAGNKRKIVDLVLAIITADQVVHPREISLLRRLYEILGYENITPKKDINKYARDNYISLRDSNEESQTADFSDDAFEAMSNLSEIESIVDEILDEFSY